MQKRSNVLACLHGAWAPPSHAPLPAQEFFWGAVQRAGGVRSRVIPTSHGDIPPGRGIVLPQNSAVCFVPLYKGGSGTHRSQFAAVRYLRVSFAASPRYRESPEAGEAAATRA